MIDPHDADGICLQPLSAPLRDPAGKLNKQVELTLQGSSTELDKSLIERIIDPLTHPCATASITVSKSRPPARRRQVGGRQSGAVGRTPWRQHSY